MSSALTAERRGVVTSHEQQGKIAMTTANVRLAVQRMHCAASAVPVHAKLRHTGEEMQPAGCG